MIGTTPIFDPEKIVKDILTAINGVLGKDLPATVDFAGRQSKALAMQAAWITDQTAKGLLKDADRDWFLNNLSDMSKTFATALAALTELTIEKAWNAIVGVLWTAITGALNAAINSIKIPAPKFA